MILYEITVDPEQLLVVTTGDEDETNEFVAVTCRYVPVTHESGTRHVALEVAFDPEVRRPMRPYQCPAHRLERILFSPRFVKRIRPYLDETLATLSGHQTGTESRVALAYADALADVARANGASVTAYFVGARHNIEQGDRASVEPNLKIMMEEIDRTTPGLWTNAENVDLLRTRLREHLPNARPEEIAIASRLLAWYPGGDAPTFAAMWYAPA